MATKGRFGEGNGLKHHTVSKQNKTNQRASSILFPKFNYELRPELVYLKMCELNFELVQIEKEFSQHWVKMCVALMQTVAI